MTNTCCLLNHISTLLKRLYTDRGYLAYTPPEDSPEVKFKPKLFGGNASIVYGSFSNPRKINTRTKALWGKIMSADGNAKIVKSNYYEDEGFKSRFIASLISLVSKKNK